MSELFDDLIFSYLEACQFYEVKQILVGGGAVNYHGYKRHSADIDFWVAVDNENLERLRKAMLKLGYDVEKWPDEVHSGLQNISIKVSPDFRLELITNFDVNELFSSAYSKALESTYNSGKAIVNYKVLSYKQLKVSKIKAGRPKDLLDIQELERIRNKK